MIKQTATNNTFLKETKRIFNHLIFKKASKIMNEDGEKEARNYVQSFTTKKLTY